MGSTDIEVRADDGRRLVVSVFGPQGGDVVLFHTGTPGARQLHPAELKEGARRGLRHVLYSRPGYEGSDRQPGRSIADCAADVAAVADALDIDSFHTVGSSGGGAHALGCAALLPGRVRSVAVISSLAPYGAEGLEWTAGMAQQNVTEFEAVWAGEAELLRYLDGEAEKYLAVGDGEQLIDAQGDLPSAEDRATLETGRDEYEAACWRRVLAGGIWGWLDDDRAHCSDWGFDLGEVTAPVTVWQGSEDRMVPRGHGEWLAGNLPRAELRLLPDEGHLSLMAHYGAILDRLFSA